MPWAPLELSQRGPRLSSREGGTFLRGRSRAPRAALGRRPARGDRTARGDRFDLAAGQRAEHGGESPHGVAKVLLDGLVTDPEGLGDLRRRLVLAVPQDHARPFAWGEGGHHRVELEPLRRVVRGTLVRGGPFEQAPHRDRSRGDAVPIGPSRKGALTRRAACVDRRIRVRHVRPRPTGQPLTENRLYLYNARRAQNDGWRGRPVLVAGSRRRPSGGFQPRWRQSLEVSVASSGSWSSESGRAASAGTSSCLSLIHISEPTRL